MSEWRKREKERKRMRNKKQKNKEEENQRKRTCKKKLLDVERNINVELWHMDGKVKKTNEKMRRKKMNGGPQSRSKIGYSFKSLTQIKKHKNNKKKQNKTKQNKTKKKKNMKTMRIITLACSMMMIVTPGCIVHAANVAPLTLLPQEHTDSDQHV